MPRPPELFFSTPAGFATGAWSYWNEDGSPKSKAEFDAGAVVKR